MSPSRLVKLTKKRRDSTASGGKARPSSPRSPPDGDRRSDVEKEVRRHGVVADRPNGAALFDDIERRGVARVHDERDRIGESGGDHLGPQLGVGYRGRAQQQDDRREHGAAKHACQLIPPSRPLSLPASAGQAHEMSDTVLPIEYSSGVGCSACLDDLSPAAATCCRARSTC